MKKIVLALIVALITLFECKAINIKQLKGTHNIVPADYSPVMGMVLLEWRILRQWYELSPKHMKSEMAELLQNNPNIAPFQKKSIEEIQKNFKDDAVENLLHSMFHIATGNFNTTHAIDNPVMLLKAEHLGKILRVVHDWTSALSDPKKLEELKEKVKQEPKQIPELLAELSRMSPQVRQLKKQATLTQAEQQFLDDFEAKHKKMMRLRSKHGSALRSKKETDTVFVNYNLRYELMYLVEDFGFETAQKKLFKAASWNSFVNSLVDGLKLQEPGPDQVYAQNTVQEILLGYMLATSHERSDLENYFKGFLGNDNFVLPDEMYTDQEITDIITSHVNANDFKPFADLMSAFTYQEKYASKFPKIVEGNSRVAYQGIGFADCMETVIRNLVNIVTYQKGKIGIVPEGLTISPHLQKFYQTAINSDNAAVSHNNVHQNWTDVIENIEGASYNYLVYQGQKVESNCDGFIFVDTLSGLDSTLPKESVEINDKTIELIEKKVGNRTYLLVAKSPELFGCELMPNLSNMVVALNNLFNLQLYPSSKDLLEPDFASKYLQLVCEKLGWTLQNSSKVDSLDAELNITCKQGDFKMRLSNKLHGSFSVDPNDQLKINLIIPEDTQQSRVAVAISDQLIEQDQIPQALRQSCLIRNADALFDNARVMIATKMLKNWSTLSVSEKNYVQRMIIGFGLQADRYYLEHVIRNIPSTFEYKDVLFNVVIMFCIKNQDQFLLLLDSIIQRNLLSIDKINIVLYLFEKDINNSDSKVQYIIIRSIAVLIKNQSITGQQVLPFLEKGINSSDSKVQSSTMESIESLISKQSITLEQALPFLEKSLNSSDPNVQSSTMESIKTLIFNQSITTDQAFPFLKKGIDSSYQDVQLLTIKCIETLITNKSITLEQAIPFWETGINSSYPNVQSSTIESIETLISNQSIPADQALSFLEKGINSSYINVQYTIIDSIKTLISNKSITSQQALPLLKKAINYSIFAIQISTIKYIETLISNQSITTDQALPLLKEGINSVYPGVQLLTIKCIETLITNKSIPLQKALPFWEKGINSSHSDVPRTTLESIATLISNQSIPADQALALFEKSINSSDPNVQYTIINSIKTLISNKSITANQALPFLKKAIESSYHIQSLTIQCISILVSNKSITLQQALPFLEKGINSSYLGVQSLTIKCIETLIINKLIPLQKALPFWEKGINSSYSDVPRTTLESIETLISNQSIPAEQPLSFLEKSISNLGALVQNLTMESIETLISNKSITGQQVLPFLEKVINSSYPDIQSSIIKSIETLISNQSITGQQALPFLKKVINSSIFDVQISTIKCIETLISKQSITADQALPFLEKGINSPYTDVQSSTMRSIETLTSNKSITTEQALPFLKKGINSWSSNVQSLTMESIKTLISNNSITSNQMKQLIATTQNAKYKTELEELLIKVQASESILTRMKGMLSRSLGAFKSTPVSLMRHEPSDLTKYELERVGITPKQERIALQERIAPYQDFGINPAQQFDLEQQREQFLEHQQQMPEGPFYQAGQLTDVAPLIGVAGRLPNPQQQRIIMQQQYRLPTAAELRRTGVNVAKGVIRKK